MVPLFCFTNYTRKTKARCRFQPMNTFLLL